MPDRYIGDPWNNELPTRVEDWRNCPECKKPIYVTIMAYNDVEYWTCPRCKAHIKLLPENGVYGHKVNVEEIKRKDAMKKISDFKRNAKRKHLTAKNRKKYGLDDE